MRRPAASPHHRNKGFSLISVVLVLLLAGVFYVVYVQLDETAEGSVDTISEARDVGQALACQMNRRTIEQSVFSWTIGHPDEKPSIEALRRSGFHVPQCPGGGTYRLENSRVYCRMHSRE